MAEPTGIIFNIQHFSVHDGPGIRTVVFLKGCPLRCEWCANPESQVRRPQLAWNHGECIGCRECEKALREQYGCILLTGGLLWNKEAPVTDRAAVERVCPTKAFHVIGEEQSVSDVLAEVEKDAVFYANSGGGLTLSGGEPLVQGDFTQALLIEAGRRHIHRAMETTGLCKWETFQAVAAQLDYLLMDIKLWDSRLHRQYTGADNAVILENLARLRTEFPSLPVTVRTPVIPGVNDTGEELLSIARYVHSLGIQNYELLRYHRLGLPKYASLGREYQLGDVELDESRFAALQKRVQALL